jgi:hypothetical protein
MLKVVKALHLIGVVMFFGSILAHITAGFIPGARDDPQTALIARQAIDVATTYLTVPGLVLLLLTGFFMIVKGKLPILRIRWLTLHATFGSLIALNAAFVLYPTGQELLETASHVVSGALPMEQLHAIEGREAAFGAANLLLCLAAVFVGVIKPRIGKAKP